MKYYILGIIIIISKSRFENKHQSIDFSLICFSILMLSVIKKKERFKLVIKMYCSSSLLYSYTFFQT